MGVDKELAIEWAGRLVRRLRALRYLSSAPEVQAPLILQLVDAGIDEAEATAFIDEFLVRYDEWPGPKTFARQLQNWRNRPVSVSSGQAKPATEFQVIGRPGCQICDGTGWRIVADGETLCECAESYAASDTGRAA